MTARKKTAFDGLLGTLATLPQIADRVAPKVAAVVEEYMREVLRAGVDPDTGQPWEPRLKDEGRALPNAERELEVIHEKSRNQIRVRLQGIYARHHWGQVRGGTRRRMIPARKLPEALKAKVLKLVSDAISEHMKGERA